MSQPASKKEPTLFQALVPLAFLILFLFLNVQYFEDTLAGSNQMALLLAAAIAGLVAYSTGVRWKKMETSIVRSISSALPAILILFLIGALAGTWMLSGVVPTLIYYGLEILNPKIFLFASITIAALVSLATGSSWSTIATIGIALIGIGRTLGIHDGLVAGSIISGAYFGDKMSPLSDTTNLAPAMAGTDLFTHIRYMIITTWPSITLAMIAFLIIGFTLHYPVNHTEVSGVMSALKDTFYISPVLLIVPVVLIIIIVRRVPAVPALLSGILLGVIFALIFQPQAVRQVAGTGGSYAKLAWIASMKSMFGPVDIPTPSPIVTKLLATRGMAGMLNTIWLILSAMIFGGMMESGNFLIRISKSILGFVHNTTSLVASTAVTCIFFNITASDQYISIVVPGRMFAKTYRKKGYKPELLSRTLEDAGTVTSVLIPWNTGGATQATVLGVPTLTYLPYAFFNLISPFMSIFIAAINYKIRRFASGEIPSDTDGTPAEA
ncbi:MAG: Na+/H+ antiporter NhaC [Bacteroidales bacterium]|nr:Na+/H+ antiporter NhaC [Bacteroidales bacterium]